MQSDLDIAPRSARGRTAYPSSHSPVLHAGARDRSKAFKSGECIGHTMALRCDVRQRREAAELSPRSRLLRRQCLGGLESLLLPAANRCLESPGRLEMVAYSTTLLTACLPSTASVDPLPSASGLCGSPCHAVYATRMHGSVLLTPSARHEKGKEAVKEVGLSLL